MLRLPLDPGKIAGTDVAVLERPELSLPISVTAPVHLERALLALLAHLARMVERDPHGFWG
jgi:hypothetical protein